MGMPARGPLATEPNAVGSDDGTILGRAILVLSMPKKFSRVSSYCKVRIFINMVRLALELSVTCTGFVADAPPLSL